MNTDEKTNIDPEGYEPTEHDREPGNVALRAGYLHGMAVRLPHGDDDRLFLLRASRSLLAYAALLREHEETR